MFGDNRSVVASATLPHSTLSKMHNILAFHRVREAIAAKIIDFHWIKSEHNSVTCRVSIGNITRFSLRFNNCSSPVDPSHRSQSQPQKKLSSLPNKRISTTSTRPQPFIFTFSIYYINLLYMSYINMSHPT